MSVDPETTEPRQAAFAVLQIGMIAATLAAFLVPTTAASIVAMGLWLAFGTFFVSEGVTWSLRVIRHAFRRPMQPRLGRYSLIVHYAIGWLVGLFALFVFSVVAWLFGLFSFSLLLAGTLTFFAISLAGNAWTLRRTLLPGLGLLKSWIRENYAVLLLTFSAVGLMMFAIRGSSPPPFQFGWDMFQHTYAANIIRDQATFHPLPSSFSNSFIVDPYTTSFHILLAVVSFLGNGEVLLVFWIGPLFNLLLFSAGIVFLGRRLQLAAAIILTAVIFGVAFQEWNKGFSLVYFAPASIITALTPTLLGIQLGFPKINRLAEVHFASASIVLLHFLIGLFLVVAAYAIPVIRQALARLKIARRSISVVLLTLGTLVLIIPIIAWDAYNLLFRSVLDYFVSFENVFWRVSLDWKVDAITRIYYTLPLLGAAIAGALLHETRGLSDRNPTRKAKLGLSFIALLMLGSLLVYFVEVEQTSRFLFLVRPGLMLLSALFVFRIAADLRLPRRRILTAAIVTAIVASSLFPLTIFMERQRFEGDTDGMASSFSGYELAMGRWMNENLGPRAIYISDPRSQSTLLPFAMRESLYGHEMPQEFQDMLRSAILTTSAESAYENITRILTIEGIDVEEAYLVVSGRTLFWAESNLIHVYRPKVITNPSLLEHLSSPLFNLQHSIDDKIFLYSMGSA